MVKQTPRIVYHPTGSHVMAASYSTADSFSGGIGSVVAVDRGTMTGVLGLGRYFGVLGVLDWVAVVLLLLGMGSTGRPLRFWACRRS